MVNNVFYISAHSAYHQRGEWKTSKKYPKFMPYDRQLAPVYCRCSWCAGEIYMGQSYYETEDGKICMDCLPDYARKYFLADLRTAMPRGRVYVP